MVNIAKSFKQLVKKVIELIRFSVKILNKRQTHKECVEVAQCLSSLTGNFNDRYELLRGDPEIKGELVVNFMQG